MHTLDENTLSVYHTQFLLDENINNIDIDIECL
jgi:hypothetical protein